ncbi:hypothetical protein GW17_00041174 [Ensete ventricosum]|nr:hypothetical protein GW17_00041174 [Ensete ventricosum]RZS27471.1 hypothetical protein BHM03_00060949 [Ensete ventricosum]
MSPLSTAVATVARCRLSPLQLSLLLSLDAASLYYRSMSPLPVVAVVAVALRYRCRSLGFYFYTSHIDSNC